MEISIRYGTIGARDTEVEPVRAIYDAFARRDVEAALAHIAEDVVFNAEGTAKLAGRTTPYRGHDGVREYFADAARVWEDLTLYAEDIRAIAGSVVVFGRVVGTVGGKPFRSRVIWSWKLRDGKAASMRVNTLSDA